VPPTDLARLRTYPRKCRGAILAFVPAVGEKRQKPMRAAGLHKRIERFTELIDGLQREMEAVQSNHAMLNWQEYPAYLGALLKAQQGCTAAKIA